MHDKILRTKILSLLGLISSRDFILIEAGVKDVRNYIHNHDLILDDKYNKFIMMVENSVGLTGLIYALTSLTVHLISEDKVTK